LTGTVHTLGRPVRDGWRPTTALLDGEFADARADVFLDEIPSDSGRTRPPLEWFTDPGFTEETPITIDGQRVFGHIAPWDRPHLSFNGRNVFAPRSRYDYREFLRGAVKAVDENGTVRIVATGHIAANCGHADINASLAAAARFYDHTGYTVARIAVGEDQFGIWCAGILRPGVSDDQIDELLAHPPSGDWRPVGGGLELVAVACVNVPGFGTGRARVASGQVVALVASAGLPPVCVNRPSSNPAPADPATVAAAGEFSGVGETVRVDPDGTLRFFAGNTVTVRDNRIVDSGEQGIVMSHGAPTDCVIRDNVIVDGHGNYATAPPARFDTDRLREHIGAELDRRARQAEFAGLLDQVDDTVDVHADLLADLDADDEMAQAAALAELDADPDTDPADVGALAVSRMPAKLRESYLRGKVAARIRWGSPGDGTRCMAQARAHGVPKRMIAGMCQRLHIEATGKPMGEH